MSTLDHAAKKLPDGREVVGTFGAAHRVGVTPGYFPVVAKREGLQRFATRNSRGVPAHLWLVSEVEALRAKRKELEAEIPSTDIVPLPYDGMAVE